MAEKSLDYYRIAAICKTQGFEADDVFKKSMLLFDAFRNEKFLRNNVEQPVMTDKEKMEHLNKVRYKILDLFWRPMKQNIEDMRAFINYAITSPLVDDRIDLALEEIALFRDIGQIYRKLLETYYFKAKFENDNDRMAACGLSRSRFYARREEAVTLFGIIMWSMAKRKEYEYMAKGMIQCHPIFPFDAND
ncbi:MAG: hypothetical protein K6G84_15975 [Lachnospiraceae bacterium]|nr:hypothetical protein [Lachnospiraceae bacterium]